jgi:hypothetical protein
MKGTIRKRQGWTQWTSWRKRLKPHSAGYSDSLKDFRIEKCLNLSLKIFLPHSYFEDHLTPVASCSQFYCQIAAVGYLKKHPG